MPGSLPADSGDFNVAEKFVEVIGLNLREQFGRRASVPTSAVA